MTGLAERAAARRRSAVRRLAAIRCMTNRRALPLLALLSAAVGSSTSATPVVGFSSNYIDGLLERQVPAETLEPLVTAEEFDLGGRKDEALHLREFVERRVWLAALSEPPPPGGTVRDVLAAKWPEYLPQLRTRGAARLLRITVLGAWLEGEPEPAFDGVADAGYTNGTASGVTILSARFRVANGGAATVAAFDLLFDLPFTAISGLSCRWHDYESLQPAQTRDIVCRWNGEDTVLRTASQLLKDWTANDPKTALRAANVTYIDGGLRVPYALENGFSRHGDLDLARIAAARASAASCVRRSSCDDDLETFGLALDLLPWLVVPAVLGALLGRRMRRRAGAR
jgi:hypothetical protein